MNQDGVYPFGEQVRNLCLDIAKWGGDQDEADHTGVLVEEIPEKERVHDPQLWVVPSIGQWSKGKCHMYELLATCFIDSDIRYGTLSHGLLLLALW